jgi:hypothetical protein
MKQAIRENRQGKVRVAGDLWVDDAPEVRLLRWRMEVCEEIVDAPTLPLRPHVRAPAREGLPEIKDRGRLTRSKICSASSMRAKGSAGLSASAVAISVSTGSVVGTSSVPPLRCQAISNRPLGVKLSGR